LPGGKGGDVETVKVMLMSTIPISALGFYLPLARELEKHGDEVYFCFADGDEAKVIAAEGFRVKLLSMRRKPFRLANITAIVKLAFFLRKNRIDVVATTTPGASIVGRSAAVLAGVPVRINMVRGMFPRDTHRWQSLLFDCTERLMHRASTYTVTINRQDRDEMLAKGFAEEGRIACIGCGGLGVDLSRFDPHRYDRAKLKEMRDALGFLETDFIVAFVGRLTVEKGILDYVDILSRLIIENPDIKGLVVGDVLEDEHLAITRIRLKAMFTGQGIGSEVALAGFREDIPELMAVSDVVVLPSKREGFGMVLAEAAAMEKPVVAYRCRGTEEAIVDGTTGAIIEQGDTEGFADAVLYLHNNREKAKEMGQVARTEADARFSQEAVLNSYLAIYQEAVSSGSPATSQTRG
jgi:glycosyltransferase involved in cell wall biosynthesis